MRARSIALLCVAVGAALALIAVTASGATPTADISGAWEPTSGGPPWQLTVSDSGQTLNATWSGSGAHSHLHGSYTGHLVSSDSYSGRFSIVEDSNTVAGTLTFTIVSADQITGTLTPDGGSSSTITFNRVASSSAATMSGIKGKVEVQIQSGAWEAADPSVQLKPGDRIHTGYAGSVTVKLPGGATMVVGPMSLVAIDEIGGTPKARVWVTRPVSGDVRAQVQKIATASGDFEVRTPTTTASIRGSVMDVFYDPLARLTIVAAVADRATVKPTRRGGKRIVVRQGKEIVVSASGVSPLAAIGKAGARGGIDAKVALDRVLAVINRSAASCNLTAPRIAPGVKAAGPSAWTVTVPVQGKVSGTSTWKVASRRVTPLNSVAMTISRGC